MCTFFFSLSLCHSPCPIPCSSFDRFVLSSCRFPFDSCIAFFAFTFAFLLSLVADSVILLFRLGAIPPPCSLRAWSMRIPLACCLLSSFLRCWCWLIFFCFFASFPYSMSIWTSFVFILSFSCGYYAVSSVSVSAATRLAYYIYVSWYVPWFHLFISVWGIRFVSVIIVCTIFCFYLFSSWGNFPLHSSYWSLSCAHGLHCSDDLMWEQQRQQWYPFNHDVMPWGK